VPLASLIQRRRAIITAAAVVITTAATTTATLTLSFFFMVGDAHEWWFIRVGCAFDYGEREALEAENSFKVTC
jgi:hypothetical protein